MYRTPNRSMSFAILVATARRQTGTFVEASSSSRDFLTRSMSSTSDSPYYTVAITGASGLLGTAVIDELCKKNDGLYGKPIRVVKLQRGESTREGLVTSVDDSKSDIISQGSMITTKLNWNPKVEGSECINPEALESIDTLIHLAGENVGEGLLPGPLGMLGIRAWSEKKKDLIMESRVGPTKALATAIAECPKPTSYIVASGVGVYGSDFMADESDVERTMPDESVDVSNTNGFLADVSRRWEAASQYAIGEKAISKENRVVNMRLAPVLSKNGGALGKLYPIFFLGGGGIVGSGKQYFSYISARDAARAVVHIIENESLNGPVNLTAPTPVTNAEFTATLGKVLSRPTFIPLPAFVVKLVFGEMGEEMLLGGIKAAPKKLLDSNFKFNHESIELALQSAVDESI